MRFVLLAGVIILCGCATQMPLNSVPKSEQDFQAPPAELLTKYPDIERHYAGQLILDSDFRKKNLRGSKPELIEYWGEPSAQRSLTAEKNISTGFGCAALSLLFTEILPVAAAICAYEFVAMAPNESKWSKGRYEITAVTSSRDPQSLQYWTWREQSAPVPGTPGTELLPANGRKWFASLAVSGGGEIVDSQVNGLGDVKLGGFWYIAAGRRFIAPDNSLEGRLSVGIKWGSLVLDNVDSTLTVNRYPVDAILLSNLGSGWRLGGGLSRDLYAELKVASSSSMLASETYRLNETLGVIGQLEYQANGFGFSGIRYEYVKFDGAGPVRVDASNVTVLFSLPF